MSRRCSRGSPRDIDLERCASPRRRDRHRNLTRKGSVCYGNAQRPCRRLGTSRHRVGTLADGNEPGGTRGDQRDNYKNPGRSQNAPSRLDQTTNFIGLREK